MAVGEALTNIAAAAVKLPEVKLSLNWMAACGAKGEDAKLFDAVKGASDFCVALGISVPVGKDSLSMRTAWEDNGEKKSVTSPVSLIASAAAPVGDVTLTLTPELRKIPSVLVLADLGCGRARMGGSIPVSYTHLDVYKRQAHSSVPRRSSAASPATKSPPAQRPRRTNFRSINHDQIHHHGACRHPRSGPCLRRLRC